ncbi:MAG: beta-galactosidase [Clostridia bacterium]|nr:beta-galactosidase [Clostridia bacterium]
MDRPRAEYPNPQFERTDWECLNGPWNCGYEPTAPGFRFSRDESTAVSLRKAARYPYQINVPFCVESRLSGIGDTGFVQRVWYRRTVHVRARGRRVFLHVGAADHLTTVLVNGRLAGRHRGGYTSFAFEITDLVADGDNEVFILCEDNNRAPMVMRGKQSEKKQSHGCDYTRTTGIWQSVWLEYTPQAYIKHIRIFPDAANGRVTVMADFCGSGNFSCEAFYAGKAMGCASQTNAAGCRHYEIKLSETHLWEVGRGRLYDLTLRFGDDVVNSYFGLRDVRLDGYRFLLNGKSVFQRLVLDQGFYRDGIYTAPTDGRLAQDVIDCMALGFNGARLHQKVFEPRFLYHCDRLGYLVWGEAPNWGLDISSPESVPIFLGEWREALRRDCNHPAIIGWCPFNETWDYHRRRQYDPLLSTVFDFTRDFDPTRPCIDTSGNYHVKTDIYDVHDYDCDPARFKQNYDRLMTEGVLHDHIEINQGRQHYGGEPVFMSEYGGIKWAGDDSIKSWGYGVDVKTPQEFADRYCALTEALLGNDRMLGFCYTQLYDIEQEQNGLYTYDREKKFSDDIYQRIKQSNTMKAAIED